MSDETIQAGVVEYPQETQPTQPAVEEKKVESSKEQNLRIMRDRAESAERRAQELERLMQERLTPQQPAAQEEDEIDINDDSYIEGKQLKKYVKSWKKQLNDTRKEFDDYRQKSALTQAELALKSQFPDFESVVSPDNINKLKDTKPALYRSIMANQDIYDRGYTAYEMIKNSNINQETYPEVDRRLAENKERPRSAGSAPSQTSDSPLQRIGEYDRRTLTEERKNQLLKQVAEAKKYR